MVMTSQGSGKKEKQNRKVNEKMAERELRIGFPEAKMEALEFFMAKKDETAEDALREHLDKTYEKYVPPQVRDFVESRMQPDGAESSQTRSRMRAGASADEPVRQRGMRRRNQRQDEGQVQGDTDQRGRRMQDPAEETARDVQGQNGQEETVQAAEAEQEQTDGMAMQM